jgi:hypothetical protein
MRGLCVTRLSGGHYRNVELGTFFASNDEQGNSSDQRQPTEYGRNRNLLVLFSSGMDGAKIENLFFMGIGKSLIGEGQTAQDN